MRRGTKARRHEGTQGREARGGFTLIEILVVVSVLALLIGLLLPALGGARDAGRGAVCLSKLRQLGMGWTMYAGDHKGMAMPLAQDRPTELIYWWGAVGGSPVSVEHERGFLWPYLDGGPGVRSAYECPSQRWGTYRPQPAAAGGLPTSTYGYNGYYLCPPMTPGWNLQIGHQRWKRLSDLDQPTSLFVFADTLLAGSPPMNNALLDPPQLWTGSGWEVNASPTTCFRHGGAEGRAGAASTARGDGSARMVPGRPEWLTDPALRIGSAGCENGPAYVPDWRRWR